MATLSIREATEEDIPALSQICLLTADAGKSADHLHDFKELPGLVWAVPYVKLSAAWAFVLVDDVKNEVVGYIVGAKDTRMYEQHAMESWWPPLMEKYPPEKGNKPDDVRYMNLLRNKPPAPDVIVNFAAAHMHINILDAYQRQGWGRKLMTAAIEHLKGEGISRMWLIMDPRNTDGRKFYGRMGFKQIEGGEVNWLGLKFEEFV